MMRKTKVKRFIYICEKCNNELFSENNFVIKCKNCGNIINPQSWQNQSKKQVVLKFIETK